MADRVDVAKLARAIETELERTGKPGSNPSPPGHLVAPPLTHGRRA